MRWSLVVLKKAIFSSEFSSPFLKKHSQAVQQLPRAAPQIAAGSLPRRRLTRRLSHTVLCCEPPEKAAVTAAQACSYKMATCEWTWANQTKAILPLFLYMWRRGVWIPPAIPRPTCCLPSDRAAVEAQMLHTVSSSKESGKPPCPATYLSGPHLSAGTEAAEGLSWQAYSQLRVFIISGWKIPTILHFSVPITCTGMQHGQMLTFCKFWQKSLHSPPPSNSNQQLLISTENFWKFSYMAYGMALQQTWVLTAERHIAPFYH